MVEGVKMEFPPARIFYSDKSFEYHEYSDVVPLMDLSELEKLGLNMQKHGLKDPIVIYEDLILDGRNRSLSGHMFSVPLFYIKYEDTIYANLDPLDFVEIKNLRRREFKNSAQRAFSALKYLRIARRRALRRMRLTQLDGKDRNNRPILKCSASDPGLLAEEKLQKGRAIDITAKKYGIASKTLIKVEKIVNIAVKDSKIDKLWHRALKDEITIEEVYRSIQSKIKNKKNQTLNKKNDKRRPKKQIKELKEPQNDNCSFSPSNEINEPLIKVEKIVKVANHNQEVKKLWEKAKNNQIPLKKVYEDVEKIINLNKSITEHTVDNFKKAGEEYKAKKRKNNTEEKDQTEQRLICKQCPLATVSVLEYPCDLCSHINFIPGVLCDKDLKKGVRKIRYPYSPICENSPDYDLLSRRNF